MNTTQKTWRLLICLCCLTAAASALSQNNSGEAVPVIERVEPIELSRLRFLSFAFGREGPMDAPLTTPPVAGREDFVEADVFGIKTAARMRFEFVDASGRPLQTLTMGNSTGSSPFRLCRSVSPSVTPMFPVVRFERIVESFRGTYCA